MSKSWNIIQTKAKLSEVLKRASIEPQLIESRGEPIAVILSIEEYTRLNKLAGGALEKPSMKEFLKSSQLLSKKLHQEKIELLLPDRKTLKDRNVPDLGDE